MSIETPPHIVPPPDDSEHQASGWKPMNDNDELYKNEGNLLRDIRDYTSHIDLNNSDHTIEIAHPAGAELAEILTRLRELTSRGLGIGSSGVHRQPNTQVTGSSPRTTTLVHHRRRVQRVLKNTCLSGDSCIRSSNFNHHSNGRISSPGSSTCCDEVESLSGKPTGDAI